MKYYYSNIILLLLLLSHCNLKQGEETFFILDLANSNASQFKVGGSLSGLTSGSISLLLNSSENLTLTQDGIFQFTTSIAAGTSYEVTISTQPSNLYCSMSNASGSIANASTSNLLVTCNGGRRIFVTANAFNGDLGGISGADAKCMADGTKPSTGTFKAMIVDGTDRIACTNSDCSTGIGENKDWVLTSNSKYIRASDSASLFITNSSAIFIFGNMDVSFANTGSVQTWTGLTSINKWMNSPNDCSNWSSSGTGSTGRVGSSNQTDYTAIRNSNTISCDLNHHLLCVEQ